MFKRATESVVESCGKETLHPVTDLNSSEHFKPLCLVEKKESFWPFRKPKFIPTCVKITDLLHSPGDIQVTTKKVTLLESFKDIPTFDVNGSVVAKASEELQFDVSEDTKVELVMKLGDIEKTEVSWQQLHTLLETSSFKYNDQVYKNAKRSGRSLCVVIESICTKDDSSLSKDITVTGSVDVEADASKFVPTAIVPEIHTNGEVERREDKSFVLPPNTVLAYGCVEFSVGEDGFAKLHSTCDQLHSCTGEMLAETTSTMRRFELAQAEQNLESVVSAAALRTWSFIRAVKTSTMNCYSYLTNRNGRYERNSRPLRLSGFGPRNLPGDGLLHSLVKNACMKTLAEQSFEDGYLLFC